MTGMLLVVQSACQPSVSYIDSQQQIKHFKQCRPSTLMLDTYCFCYSL